MNGFRTGACFLLMVCLVGCEKGEVTGLETHDFKARLLSNGSLKLEFFRNSKLSEETIVSADRISSANSISATHYDKPRLGPWCIVECHVNPGTSMIVAWNPGTGAVYCSPGHTWGMIFRHNEDALVTVSRPHFNTPPDASEILHVNEVELTELPAYGWEVAKASAAGVEFKGTSQLGEPMLANMVLNGRWSSPTGKDYDVFYLYFDLQMHVRGSNVRGIHRVFFVRNGKLVMSAGCSAEIIVQDNQLLEKNIGGAFVPWSEMEIWAKDL